jgi:putative heme iron utilization protein
MKKENVRDNPNILLSSFYNHTNSNKIHCSMAEIYWRIKEKALANKLNLLANAFIVFISSVKWE